MTNEEAKKAGFRTASGALYVYWCIENGHIYVRSCDACALTGNDFPTRAKAREALRKRKENEEVNRKSRFIDNFVQPMQEHLSSKSKADAKHAKWLADMQSQTTPITPEQAKDLLAKDTVCWPTRAGSIQQGEWGKAKQWFTDCPFWFTLEAYRTSLANQKSVESHETPIGDTQQKEVATDETQDKEPVKWAERKKGEAAIPTDSWTYNDVVGPQDPSELFNAHKRKGDHLVWQEPDGGNFNHKVGGLGNGGGHLRARYVTPEWKAWKARQDEKDVKTTKPVEHKLPDLPSWAPPLPEGYVPLGFGGTFKEVDGSFHVKIATWKESANHWDATGWYGGNPVIFYAAPRDSEIVRLNFPWLAKHGNDVESHETPVGEAQAKEVVTGETQRSPSKPLSDSEFKKLVGRMSLPQLYDALKANGVKLDGIGLEPKLDKGETQDAEPVKWAERKRDEVVQAGDEVLYAGCDWHPASHEVGKQAVGVLGDYSCPLGTRYTTPEWTAWKARQDTKESNKEHVAPVHLTKPSTVESTKPSNKSDTVSHPSHYTSHPSGIECITITKHMNFCRGNAVKYLWRAGRKGDTLDKEIEDIAKAEEYCRIEKERLIAMKGAK